MSAVILPFEAQRAAAAPVAAETGGAAEIAFGPDGGLRHLYQKSPLRLMLPRTEPGEIPAAVLVNTAGGIVGGDRLRIDARVEPGGAATLTAQAAEKVYRSLGAISRIETTLAVAPGAWLEWAPQETILYDRSRLERRLDAEVAPGGRLLAGEILVFGRAAHGERITRQFLHDRWRIHRAGRLVWADALRLTEAAPDRLTHPAGFDGATAAATLVHAGDGAGRWLETARALLPADGVRAGATVVGDLLLVRLLGREARPVRRAFVALWQGLRAAIAGLPPRMPAVWAF